MPVYQKLVRDQIPDIIRAKGQLCFTRVLEEAEYLEKLHAKLDEELAEYHQDQTIEELADLLEVIYAAAEAMGCTRAQLEQVREQKARQRGGFRKRLLLTEVRDPEAPLAEKGKT